MPPASVLILCTGNSARSQMAERFLKSFAPELDVYSAGTEPAAAVNPCAVRVMAELGLDISRNRTKSVTAFLQQSFDFVITVCDDANRACPAFTGSLRRRLHMGFADPARAAGSQEEILEAFRGVRDRIRERMLAFCSAEIGPAARNAV